MWLIWLFASGLGLVWVVGWLFVVVLLLRFVVGGFV